LICVQLEHSKNTFHFLIKKCRLPCLDDKDEFLSDLP
jgi:hypothetical protein